MSSGAPQHFRWCLLHALNSGDSFAILPLQLKPTERKRQPTNIAGKAISQPLRHNRRDVQVVLFLALAVFQPRRLTTPHNTC